MRPTKLFVSAAAVFLAFAAASRAPAQDGSTQAQDQETARQQFADLVEKMKEFVKRLREHGDEEKAALVEKALTFTDDKKVTYQMAQAIEAFKAKNLNEGKKLAADLRGNLDEIIAILERRSALSDLDQKRRELEDSRKEISEILARETKVREETQKARDAANVD